MTTVAVGHVLVDDDGVARIQGSRIKVTHLVMEKMANDWTPEELQRQYPHLTVSQIYAALAYYFGHQSEMDAEIEQNVRDADRMQAEAGESALAKRLREAGKLK